MAFRGNQRLNADIERHIGSWRGTAHGQIIENMYKGEAEYEAICEAAGIDYEEYEEEQAQ